MLREMIVIASEIAYQMRRVIGREVQRRIARRIIRWYCGSGSIDSLDEVMLRCVFGMHGEEGRAQVYVFVRNVRDLFPFGQLGAREEAFLEKLARAAAAEGRTN